MTHVAYKFSFLTESVIPLRKSEGPIHLKMGFRLFSSRTWSFLIRLRLVRTFAISYKRRTLAKPKQKQRLWSVFQFTKEGVVYKTLILGLPDEGTLLFSKWKDLLLYLLWLESSWPSSISILAAVSSVTVRVFDTRNNMTNFWLMMRSDLSFLRLEATVTGERETNHLYWCFTCKSFKSDKYTSVWTEDTWCNFEVS